MISYKEYKEIILEEILELYRNVEWSNYYNNPGMVEKAFLNSLYIYGAYDNDKLIGFIRIVGDGYSIIYIQDIVVKKIYQRQGIGTRLLSDVLNKYLNVYQKVLLTDNTEKTKSFYKTIGFSNVEEIDCVSFIKY